MRKYDRIGKKHFSPDVMQFLTEYAWPGNVRELENEVQKLIVLSSQDEITKNTLLSDSLVVGQKSQTHDLAFYERLAIQNALGAAGNNKSKAADILGISRNKLTRKMMVLKIES